MPTESTNQNTNEKLLEFARMIDFEYGTTYQGDAGQTLTTEELLSEWLKTK